LTTTRHIPNSAVSLKSCPRIFGVFVEHIRERSAVLAAWPYPVHSVAFMALREACLALGTLIHGKLDLDHEAPGGCVHRSHRAAVDADGALGNG
jgi:hypothetical protein